MSYFLKELSTIFLLIKLIQGKILTLSSQNYEKEINSNEFLFIKFCNSKEIDCKQAFKIFRSVEKELNFNMNLNKKIQFAEVDNIDNKELLKEEILLIFPKSFLFINGTRYEYAGTYSVNKIVPWLVKIVQQKILTNFENFNQLKKFIFENQFLILLVIPEVEKQTAADKNLIKSFEHASFEMLHCEKYNYFAYVSDKIAKENLKIKKTPSIIFLNSLTKISTLENNIEDISTIVNFYVKNTIKDFSFMSEYILNKIIHSSQEFFLYFFEKNDKENDKRALNFFENNWNKFEKKKDLKIIFCEFAVEQTEILALDFNLQIYPSIRILNYENNEPIYYSYENIFSLNKINEFLIAHKNGKLKKNNYPEMNFNNINDNEDEPLGEELLEKLANFKKRGEGIDELMLKELDL